MHFDGSISAGTILGVITLVFSVLVTYHKATSWLDTKLTEFQTTLSTHGSQLARHAERMDRYEERYVRIAGDLQWLVGLSDANRHRRAGPEHPER